MSSKSPTKKTPPPPVQAPKAKPQASAKRPRWPLWLGLAVLVAVAATIAVVMSSGGSSDTGGIDPTKAQVTIEGSSLPRLSAESDEALGMQAPGLSGVDLDGSKMTVPAGPGGPRLVVFLAHWCPHCRAEVPRIVDWYRETGGVEGVDVYTVATGIDPRRPNYPPKAWLESEGWPYPTLLDNASSSAAAAYGLSAYPFFVFVDADGNVVSRDAGEIDVTEIENRLVALRDSTARGESG